MAFTWNGRAGRGAMAQHRAKKRAEAEARQAAVLPENTRAYREGRYKWPHSLTDKDREILRNNTSASEAKYIPADKTEKGRLK